MKGKVSWYFKIQTVYNKSFYQKESIQEPMYTNAENEVVPYFQHN